MTNVKITGMDRALARICAACPLCRHARGTRRGPALWLVMRIESGICPFCRAYRKVYGRKAHELNPVPGP